MTGLLARSRAGHDKGRLYLVIGEADGLLLLSDGVTRGLLNPKKKKRKHLQPAGRAFSEEETEEFFRNPSWADNVIRERISREDRAQKSGPAI